jgi:hypothetical protein
MTSPCPCAECVLAGCDRPPVMLAKSKLFPARELHGRELARHYARQDENRAVLAKIRADVDARSAK